MKKGPLDLGSGSRFFLSSMMGITDGAFCADRGVGCALVQLGAYLAEPTATMADKGGDAASFLPPDPQACTAFLALECSRARGPANARVCLNLATPRLEWALEAASCFWQAGGDLLELNVHGGYERYLEQGKLRAMVRPEHQQELYRWVEALAGLGGPLVVKFNMQHDREHVLHVLRALAGRPPIFGVHINVRGPGTNKPDLDAVREARECYPGFLLVSGYVWSAAAVRAVLNTGADMVGVAAPTMNDATYIRRLGEAFKAEQNSQ